MSQDPRSRSPSGDSPASFRILLVCTGNTCRSPMAEVILRRNLEDRGWSQVEVRSAGVGAFPGQPATEEAVQAAARRDLDLTEHRSTPLDPELVGWADLILTMTGSHLASVTWAGGGERSAVITAYAAGPEGAPEDALRGVSDPIGGGEEAYEETFQELEELLERVLDRLAPEVGG
jgi:protein arginine phosphatase